MPFTSLTARIKMAVRVLIRYLPFDARKIITFGRFLQNLPKRLYEFSPGNQYAAQQLLLARFNTCSRLLIPSKHEERIGVYPCVDISVVTFDSDKWITPFVNSLIASNYDRSKLSVFFVDHSSSTATVEKLEQAVARLNEIGIRTDIKRQENLGFGAGHNLALRHGEAPFCLVANIDLTFQDQTIQELVKEALFDEPNVAAWEVRQIPFEHPKYYDPVTGFTQWNSHACVLFKREAFESVGGYDTNLFMYGEDVELSYRLRRNGYLLRYCPSAVVSHQTYEYAGQIKPLQYSGKVFSNFYNRLKFGSAYDIAMLIVLAAVLLFIRSPFDGARLALLKEYLRLLKLLPTIINSRKSSKCGFPFRGLDYELARFGSFYQTNPAPFKPPLISVITRTFGGRNQFLLHALATVAKQTYPNIEHIVVEDGGDNLNSLVSSFKDFTAREIVYLSLPKVGRSTAGNAGLLRATGQYCIFLDDDDLFFADHIEVLFAALSQNPTAVAAYSPAIEVITDSSYSKSCMSYKETKITQQKKLMHPFDYEKLKQYNYMAIQSVLFKTTLFQQRGGFETDMDALEDWNLWLRYGFGNQFVYVPKATSLFRTPYKRVHRTNRQLALDKAYFLALERIKKWEAAEGKRVDRII